MDTKNELTHKQKKFLIEVSHLYPYTNILWSINKIIACGWYTDYEQEILNKYNKEWISTIKTKR